MSKTKVIQRLAALFAATLFLASCASPTSDVPLEGAIAAQSAICRPEMTVDGQRYEAGTAFIVDGPQRLLVTAHHLFGNMGGLDEEILWSEMPRRATAVRCVQLQGKGEWKTGAALAIDGAVPLSPILSTELRDIASFPVTGDAAKLPALRLAESEPATGSKVWLVAQIKGGDPVILLHRATVVGHEKGAMIYAFDNKQIELQATSGAPVVDAAGKLVGINLGGTSEEGSSEVQGLADSLTVVKNALSGLKPG